MKELLFATGNKDKVEEAKAILDMPIEIADIEIEEVQPPLTKNHTGPEDLEYVARRKVEEAYKQLGKPVFVDDVGVFFEAWNGYPGPLIKYMQQIPGNLWILEKMRDEKNRNVTVQSAIAYHDGENTYVFIGSVNGTLAKEERGNDGWGFDPVFIPDGQDKTYGEMGLEGKSIYSHRQRGLHLFKEYLDSQGKQKGI